MGDLTLYTKDSGATYWTSLWTKTGNQGTSWGFATVAVNAQDVKLSFEMTAPSSYTDIAIDSIEIDFPPTVAPTTAAPSVSFYPTPKPSTPKPSASFAPSLEPTRSPT